MDASIVIPTHNRAALLDGALESLAAQSMANDRFEVLVVDNGSQDDTRAVADRWIAAGRLPGRYVREESLGLTLARNRGISEARAGIIAFIDDDVRVEPHWLAVLVQAFEDSTVWGVGGKIRLQWQSPPPPWIHANHRKLLAELDLGPSRCRVHRYPYLVGANLAFTAETFRRVGLFHEDLDRQGSNLLSGGDTEFCHRVVQAGGVLIYEPTAVVGHLVPPERLRLSFFVRRSYDQGRTVCRYLRISGSNDRSPGRTITLIRNLRDIPVNLLRRDLTEAARALTTAAWHLGYLREARASR